MARRYRTDEFILKAKAKHGDKFDYSKVNYINTYTHVEIICNSCQKVFWQNPRIHLKSYKCPKCYDFILRAKAIHGDLYDYDLVEYITSSKNVDIWCNRCNSFFEQTPSSHIDQKAGCKKCSNSVKKDLKTFIKQAKEKHGDKYRYDKAVYVNTNTKVEIFCNNCNNYFWQLALDHVKGRGCCHCAGLKRSTTKEFIVKSKNKFGNKYNYYLVNYINSKTDVTLICNCCKQMLDVRPNTHLTSRHGGCSCYLDSTVDPFQLSLVYLITNSINNKNYVGITTKNFDDRFKQHLHPSQNSIIYREVEKYGLNNFYHSILEETIAYFLKDKEDFWINKFNTKAPKGYNTGNAGAGIYLSYIPTKAQLIERGYLDG